MILGSGGRGREGRGRRRSGWGWSGWERSGSEWCGCPGRWGPRRVGGPKGGRAKISRFFFLLPLPFCLFFSLGGSSRPDCTFWLFCNHFARAPAKRKNCELRCRFLIGFHALLRTIEIIHIQSSHFTFPGPVLLVLPLTKTGQRLQNVTETVTDLLVFTGQ